MATPANTLPRQPIWLRIVGTLAALAAGALLAWVVAFWGWRWFAPASAPPAPTREASSWGPAILASPMFGQPSAPSAATTAVPATLQGETRLLGVFAERDGGGYALFRIAGTGAVLVRVGGTLVDGVRLVAVRPDGVRLDDHGTMRDIALRAPPAASPAPTKTVATSAAARNTCNLPAGYRGPIYRLNAELLSGISAQPDNWQSLVAPSEGALVVREGNALAGALGLAAGDRITQANGIALARIDDVVTAIVRPLLASQSVRVVGLHNGKPTEWMLVNAGACPV